MGSAMPYQKPSAQSQGGWQGQFAQDYPSLAMSNTTQDQIIGNRADSVTQFLGQITPPDTNAVTSQKRPSETQESDAAKRKERARNAANKRHAKSKKVRTGSESNGGEEYGLEDRGQRQAHYREKNRVAAAKCRAKKKSHNDNLEEIHRDEASKNKILKAELMSLRNELAQLKGLSLEHGPDSCQCHGIHEYSLRQANLIARGAAPQYGPSAASPAQESMQSAGTPVSDVAAEGFFSNHEQMSPVSANVSRRPSSFAPGNWMQPP